MLRPSSEEYGLEHDNFDLDIPSPPRYAFNTYDGFVYRVGSG